MRNPKEIKTGSIEAKDARICWDAVTNKVFVSDINQNESRESFNMCSSGGACYTRWREICQTKKLAIVVLFKLYFELTHNYEISPDVVDDAFAEIIEWNDIWRDKKTSVYQNLGIGI